MFNTAENRLKALIIDDEEDICYLLSSILANRNLDSEIVHSFTDAKRALKNNGASVVFLDNHLPDGHGVNLIKDIKRQNPSAKIVMITAHDSAADRKKAFDEGADQFISKPFTKDIILKALYNALPPQFV